MGFTEPLTEISTRNRYERISLGRRVWLMHEGGNITFDRWLSRHCEILNISLPHRPPQPVMWIALLYLIREHFFNITEPSCTYCHVLWMGSVTNNSTWIRIEDRIYSLWRFTTSTGYNYWHHCSTRSFSNPADGTALHCSDVFPELTHFKDWLIPLLPSLYNTQPAQWKNWPSYCWLPCNRTVPRWWA
jgi:hypothetical protein